VVKEPHKKIEKAEGGARITVKSPLPGVILQVNVNQGDKVTRGQKLLVMEAMKMENEIKSDTDGVITAIKVAPGQSVLQDEVMLEIN
jgi:biotin carboxyl carrier protein